MKIAMQGRKRGMEEPRQERGEDSDARIVHVHVSGNIGAES